MNLKVEKTRFLNEAVAVTKMSCFYLNRIFVSLVAPVRKTKSRIKDRKYRPDIGQMIYLWKHMNRSGVKKMFTALSDWVSADIF